MCSELVCLKGHREHPCATWALDLSKDAFMARSLKEPSRRDWIQAEPPASAWLVPLKQGWKRLRPDSGSQHDSRVMSPNICHRWCKLQVSWCSAGKQGPCLSQLFLWWPVLAFYRACEVSPDWKWAQIIGCQIKFGVSAGSTEPRC